MNHQVLKNECDIKFDDCLKNTHIKNKKVFDFAKIKSLFADFHIFVLATNRGSFAKTTGAKQLGLDE